MAQEISAAKAGFSVRTGRTWEKRRKAPSQREQKYWRRRKDHFVGVWEEVIVPYLRASPFLTGITLLEHLQDLYPGQFSSKHLRSLQRRIKEWKALNGAEREVIFRQNQIPGLRGLSDFTIPKTFQVTIQGKPLLHILYHYRLAYSQWAHVRVVLGGESFSALAHNLQDALRHLGGSPQEHRTDSLSAAFKNLSQDDRQDITQRYESLCEHYGMRATRNNRGQSHENGSIEGAHGYLKRRIHQGLALRGSHDFTSIEEYQRFIDGIVARHNNRHKTLIEEEKVLLKPLPSYKACDFEEVLARVTTSSTILVKKSVYSVPSSFVGERLRVHVYDQVLSCYLGNNHILNLSRVYSRQGETKRCINYRHLIGSLAHKPQAFRYSVLRDDMLPNATYKKIWKLIDQRCTMRHACKLMVGILKLAADCNCEWELGEKVLRYLEKGLVPGLGDLQRQFQVSSCQREALPSLIVSQHSLACYQQLHSKSFLEMYHG